MGTFDLKESMEEVRRRNEPKLAAEAGLLCDLVPQQPEQERGGDALFVFCFKFNVIVLLCMKK